VSISDLNLTNVSLGSKPFMIVHENINALVVKNSNFHNVKVADGQSILGIGDVQFLEIDTLSFSEIAGETSESVNNFMVEIRTINLISSEPFLIKNVVVNK
jgi:hypothetical protein